MSRLGTEAQLLARLMAQARKEKLAIADTSVMVQDQSAGSEDNTYEQPPRARAASKKRRVTEEVAMPLTVTTVSIAQVVTSTGLRVGEHVGPAIKRTKVVSSAAKATASGMLKIIAEEVGLEDDGFVRRVAERLRLGGLDRMVQLQDSPKENRAKAFDSVMRGLHNLYLIDSLEEDVALKKQVATLEAGLLVEKTEKNNVTRQRDTLKAKLESTIGERDKLKARVGDLEREEASKCKALEDEIAGLKAKVAELPEVVARERKVAAEEALAHFTSSSEVVALKAAEYDRGFEARYSKHFNTFIEKDWINVDKYYADVEREEQERREKAVQEQHSQSEVPSTKSPGGEIELVHLEDEVEGLEGSDQGDGQEVFRTPERPLVQRDTEEGDANRDGVKSNGDPLTPGVTPSTGGV